MNKLDAFLAAVGRPMLQLAMCFCLLLLGCDERKAQAPERVWNQAETDFPPPLFEGTPVPYPDLPVAFDRRLDFPTPAFVRPDSRNLAVGKPVTSSIADPVIGRLAQITDCVKDSGEGYYVLLDRGLQWIQIDLDMDAVIDVIWVWHRSSNSTYVYNDVIVEVSNDSGFEHDVVQIFNNDFDNSAGRGKGNDRPYTESRFGKPIQAGGARGRYVRLYSCGRNGAHENHYTEVEVFGRISAGGFADETSQPVDPMSLAFRSFEKDLWAQSGGVMNLAHNIRLEEDDRLVVSVIVGQRFTPENLPRLVRLASSLWNLHLPDQPLRCIEIRSENGTLLDRWKQLEIAAGRH